MAGKNEDRKDAWKESFESILDRRERPERELCPAFFADLNLDQVVRKICGDWGKEVAAFYETFPADAECEDYRREIYADVKREGCADILCDFLEEMRERAEALNKKKKVHGKLQKAVWHIREVRCYCSAFRGLSEALSGLELYSEGMLGFRAFLQGYLAQQESAGMREQAENLWERLSDFGLTLTYENDRITVSGGKAGGAYEKRMEGCFSLRSREIKMRSPFDTSLDLVELEQEVLSIFRKQEPEFFREAEQFAQRYETYAEEVLLRFASEIRFYLSFYAFEREMREQGFAFCRPCMGGTFCARGVYDLALACAAGKEREIVNNNVRYEPGERFLVVTGPNQGGKTTFARSMGQMIYFAKMGLDVPAESADLPYFADILTHFSVEESVETGRGKLKEELVRLAPMMHGGGRKQEGNRQIPAFVVINELFTTAANYDACIMGKRVLQYFMAQGSLGIYVTHLKELSEAGDGIVSLRATVDEQGRQTFRIERGAAADSASAANQVRKHGMTYGELKRRLEKNLGGLS